MESNFKNADRLKKRLRAYNKKVCSNVDKALYQGGLLIAADAKLNCTVDTGYLRQSIDVKLIKKNGKTYAQIGTNVEYAAFIEFGTRPHFPPVKTLTPWVLKVVLNNQENYDGEAESIAFAIAKSIAKWGTMAQPFLHPAYEANIQGVRVMIKQAFIESGDNSGKS